MAPPATTRTTPRRIADVRSPRVAVTLMALASALLLAVVLIALPRPAEGTNAPILSVEEEPAEPTSLVSAPSRIVLPTPSGEEAPSTRVIVNHRQADVSLDAQLANGDGLTVDLAEAGPRATAITVTSDRVHVCGHYAGSLILEATHDSLPSDLAVLEVRHAECGEAEAVTMAPASVNDTSQTWGDEGRAPWNPVPAPPPPPEAPQPPPPPPAPEPEPEVVEEQVQTQEAAPEPEPEPEPTTTSEPEPEPTATSEPEPEPTTTSEPTSDDSTSEPSTDDGGSSTTTATAEPTTTETSTESSTEG